MKGIASLLQNIQQGKSDIQSIVSIVKECIGVQIQEKDIQLSNIRGVTQVRFDISGAKKTLLSIKRGVLQEKLKERGIILL